MPVIFRKQRACGHAGPWLWGYALAFALVLGLGLWVETARAATDTTLDSIAKNPATVYAVTAFDELEVRYGTFESMRTKGHKTLITFKRAFASDTTRAETFTVTWGEAQARPAHLAETEGERNLAEMLQRLNLALSDVGRLMFGLDVKLTDSARFAVYGEPGLGGEAKLVAERIERFDRAMEALGFALPRRTQIFLSSESPAVAGLASGPITLKTALWSPFRGKVDRVVKLSPIKGVRAVVVDPSVLAHERFHSLLTAHYLPGVFFNQSRALALQEALADFASAHNANDPVIGSSSLELRDLAKSHASGRGSFALTRAMFRPHDEHENSLAYSSILWRLRTVLGAERTTRDLKPLIDRLAEVSSAELGPSARSPLELEGANLKAFLGALTDYYRHDSKALAVLKDAARANLLRFELPRHASQAPSSRARAWAAKERGHTLRTGPLAMDRGLMALATARLFMIFALPFAALALALRFAGRALKRAYGLARSSSYRVQAPATR